MTASDCAQQNSFSLAVGDGSREITGIYCCDLLSIVMGRAPAGSAWVTVMGNLNAIAVAVLADISCIVLAENMPLDADAKARADQENITVLRTPLPVFDAAAKIAQSAAVPPFCGARF